MQNIPKLPENSPKTPQKPQNVSQKMGQMGHIRENHGTHLFFYNPCNVALSLRKQPNMPNVRAWDSMGHPKWDKSLFLAKIGKKIMGQINLKKIKWDRGDIFILINNTTLSSVLFFWDIGPRVPFIGHKKGTLGHWDIGPSVPLGQEAPIKFKLKLKFFTGGTRNECSNKRTNAK